MSESERDDEIVEAEEKKEDEEEEPCTPEERARMLSIAALVTAFFCNVLTFSCAAPAAYYSFRKNASESTYKKTKTLAMVAMIMAFGGMVVWVVLVSIAASADTAECKNCTYLTYDFGTCVDHCGTECCLRYGPCVSRCGWQCCTQNAAFP